MYVLEATRYLLQIYIFNKKSILKENRHFKYITSVKLIMIMGN